MKASDKTALFWCSIVDAAGKPRLHCSNHHRSFWGRVAFDGFCGVDWIEKVGERFKSHPVGGVLLIGGGGGDIDGADIIQSAVSHPGFQSRNRGDDPDVAHFSVAALGNERIAFRAVSMVA